MSRRRANQGFFERLRGPSTVSYRGELGRRRRAAAKQREGESKKRKLAAARERAIEREQVREAARREREKVKEANRVKREMLALEAQERRAELAAERRRMSEAEREQERLFKQVQREERAERKRRKRERETEGLGPGYEFDMNPRGKKLTAKQRGVIHALVFGRRLKPTPEQRKAVDKAIDSAYRHNPEGVKGEFARCVRAVEERGGAYDPRAVCAEMERRKYGQKELTRRSVAGKKKKAKANRGGFERQYTRAKKAGFSPQLEYKAEQSLRRRQKRAKAGLPVYARGGVPKQKRNPEEGAAAMYEKFHGRPATKVEVFTEDHHEHGWLAKMGRLLYLLVKVSPREAKLLDFGSHGVRCACTEDGGQIYFVGGDMETDLSAFPGLKPTLPKDHVELGPCVEIGYHTQKGFHKFEPTDYYHKFGKPKGTPPMLNYDVLNNRPYLVGGTYQVKPEGIVN